MNFAEQLEQLAREGQQRHVAVEADQPTAGALVKRLRRARAARTGAVAFVAVLGVALAVAVLSPRDTPTPAAPVPGQSLWTTSVEGAVWGEPAIVDGLVVAGDETGAVTALSASDGTVGWAVDVGAPVRAGVVAATVHGEGALFVVADDGALTRLSASGETAWSVNVGTAVTERDTFDQITPALAIEGAVGYIGGRDSMLRAIDLTTGEEIFNVYTDAPVVATAAVADGRVVVGDLDGGLAAYDATTGERLWRRDLGEPIYSSPGISGDTAVTGSRGTYVVGVDVSTGTDRWTVSLAGSWAESSVEVDGATVYVGSSNGGRVLAIDAPTGSVVWRTTVGGWPWARPTLADGVLYVTTAWPEEQMPPAGSLQALEPATGKVTWTAMVGGASDWRPEGAAFGAMASPAVGPGCVIVAALDGTIAAFAR